MNKICGYTCEHNKGGVCQITMCDKQPYITTTTKQLEHCKIFFGGRGHSKTKQIIESQQQEIERLNNIINEIEKFMDEDYEYYKKYGSAEQGHAMGQISRFRNKMKELKGVDKE